MRSRTRPPGDNCIRRALLSHLEQQHGHESSTRIFQELGLCGTEVRADIAVVNGILHGYEIKSDRDSLRRLENQVLLYSRVFDRATVVVGRRHVKHAASMVPNWWGILIANQVQNQITLATVREGSQNTSRDPRALVEFLWRDDAIALLECHDAARGVRSKPRSDIWDRICERIDIETISNAVTTHLKARPTPASFLPQL